MPFIEIQHPIQNIEREEGTTGDQTEQKLDKALVQSAQFEFIWCANDLIVKLRFRSRSGEGQVKLRKVRKVRYLDLSYTIFLVFNIDSGSLNIDSGSHTNF